MTRFPFDSLIFKLLTAVDFHLATGPLVRPWRIISTKLDADGPAPGMLPSLFVYSRYCMLFTLGFLILLYNIEHRAFVACRQHLHG